MTLLVERRLDPLVDQPVQRDRRLGIANVLLLVVSVSQRDDLAVTVIEVADHVIASEETRLGHHFHGASIETTA